MMHETMSGFVRTENNANAIECLSAILADPSHQMNIMITGPKFSGKSTLVKGFAFDMSRIDETCIFICSGSDIEIALALNADDSFFDKLGMTQVLVIDDLELLFNHEDGDHLFSLLLANRIANNLSTVITADCSLPDLQKQVSLSSFELFCEEPILPLDAEGRILFVKNAIDYYCNDQSPTLTDDGIDYIANHFSSHLSDLENATRYLMTESSFEKSTTINKNFAKKTLIA